MDLFANLVIEWKSSNILILDWVLNTPLEHQKLNVTQKLFSIYKFGGRRRSWQIYGTTNISNFPLYAFCWLIKFLVFSFLLAMFREDFFWKLIKKTLVELSISTLPHKTSNTTHPPLKTSNIEHTISIRNNKPLMTWPT